MCHLDILTTAKAPEAVCCSARRRPPGRTTCPHCVGLDEDEIGPRIEKSRPRVNLIALLIPLDGLLGEKAAELAEIERDEPGHDNRGDIPTIRQTGV